MFRKLWLLILFGILIGNEALCRSQKPISLTERMLERIEEPVLRTYSELEEEWSRQYAAVYVPSVARALENPPAWAPLNLPPDIPKYRRYQNRHIAPTRIYVGSAAVVVGGVMMFAGYRQDTKYPWSGPYMSASPLNVFGALIVVVGLSFIASGLIFYSKFKKHTIEPYNKSY